MSDTYNVMLAFTIGRGFNIIKFRLAAMDKNDALTLLVPNGAERGHFLCNHIASSCRMEGKLPSSYVRLGKCGDDQVASP